MWKLEDNIGDFLELCERVLSDNPLFVILNSYTTGLQPAAMSYLLSLKVGKKRGGTVTSDEIGKAVLQKLRKLDAVSYIRYASVYRDFDDIKSFLDELETINNNENK